MIHLDRRDDLWRWGDGRKEGAKKSYKFKQITFWIFEKGFMQSIVTWNRLPFYPMPLALIRIKLMQFEHTIESI